MQPNKKTARVAGLLYFVVVLTGIFTLAYVPSRLIEWNDTAQTFNNIKNGETLFRLSIVAGVVCYTAFLILPFFLYKLLHQVSNPHAIGMVILSVVSVPIALYNLVNKANVLTFITNERYLQEMELAELQTQVLIALNTYDNGIRIVSVFWGLWLLPFGYLVFKSLFLPRLLGILLMAGCFGYLINFIGYFLYQNYADLGIRSYVSLPASLGEIGISLWLLIIGIRERKQVIN